MKTEIDWSKAPEWAKKLGTNPHGENAWLGDEGYSYLLGNGGVVSWSYETAFAYTAFKIIEVRPAEWSGEGLPPVGTVCDIKIKGVSVWCPAKILFCQDNALVISWRAEGVAHPTTLDSVEIRPIRTPEQIAEDEKQRAVSEMEAQIAKWGLASDYNGMCQALYDAGYRKQVSND